MHTIKSVGVLSVAKIMGAIYGVMGIIAMPFVLLIGMLSSLAGDRNSQLGAVGTVAMAIVLPVFYGLLGFIMGALMAFLYNLMARWMGGIQIQVEHPAPIVQGQLG